MTSVFKTLFVRWPFLRFVEELLNIFTNVRICRYVALLYRHGYNGWHIWYFCHVYI